MPDKKLWVNVQQTVQNECVKIESPEKIGIDNIHPDRSKCCTHGCTIYCRNSTYFNLLYSNLWPTTNLQQLEVSNGGVYMIQQTSSKLPANVFKIPMPMLDVCWIV